jgi:hypothetical protein
MSDLSDPSWSDWDDYNKYRYHQVFATEDNIYPLNYHPVRQLSEAATGYLETQLEAPLYNSTHSCFIELAACIDAIHYERELKFHRFQELPAELRLEVYTRYLAAESKTSGGISTRRHQDRFGNACCVWNWPLQLAVCDHTFVPLLDTSTLAPLLPSLAFANKQIYDELVLHMLQTTEMCSLLYIEHKPVKIATCFKNFLDKYSKAEAINAIKYLNFPRIHHYNETRVGRVIDERNPDIELMLRCPRLETIRMTFKWPALLSQEPSYYWQRVPRSLDNFLDHFQLRPMLGHPSLKQVYLEGIFDIDKEADLVCLEQFAKWVVKGFREGQGRVVDVYLHRRDHHWVGGEPVGEKVVGD